MIAMDVDAALAEVPVNVAHESFGVAMIVASRRAILSAIVVTAILWKKLGFACRTHEYINVPISGNKSTTFPLRIPASLGPVATNVPNGFSLGQSIASGLAGNKHYATATSALNAVIHGSSILKTIEKV